MKCDNCGNEVDEGNFCPKCGKELKKKRVKFSLVTIISLVFLILISTIAVGMILYSVVSASASGNDAYGWLFFLVLIAAILIVPYYLVIFIVSRKCDQSANKNHVVRNILVIFFLLLPFISFGKMLIDTKKESNKLSYEYYDMSVDFPGDMRRISTAKDINGNYTAVEFYKDNCSIKYYVNKYYEDLSLIENFKEHSDRYNIMKSYPETIYKAFDLNYNLEYKNINGKTWNLYEKAYAELYYKLYGIRIGNHFYKIEVVDRNNTQDMCDELTRIVLSTVKYK